MVFMGALVIAVALGAAAAAWWLRRSRPAVAVASGAPAGAPTAPLEQADLDAPFLTAFRGASVGLALLDAQGRLLDFNEALRRMSGHQREELVGRAFLELLHPDDRAEDEAAFAALVRGERDQLDAKRRGLRKDEGALQLRYTATALRDPAGRFLRVIAIVEDITERQALRVRLAAADRLASLGTLAAGVANEITNPLAYLTGNLGYAREVLSAGAATPPEALTQARQALDEANEGALRVRQIVSDLKVLSREGDLRREPVDVPGALRAALNVAAGLLRPRADVKLDLGPLPPAVGDPAQLGQAFLDLLVNAGQAIQEGRPEANQIRVVAGRELDGRLKVEISDTGRGIPPDDLAHVFTPFSTTGSPGAGSGLGLARCHRTVTEMGGEIQVQSEVGKGSTFTVLLPPAAVASRPASMTPHPGRPLGPRARILVVDDEPYVGRTMRRILGESHDVEVVDSARAALDRLGQAPAPDVILCDLMMPGMTGMELHAALLQRDRAAAGRMVFVTGGALHEAARAFIDAVGNPVVEKPFATDLLRAVVEETLRRGRAARPPVASA